LPRQFVDRRGSAVAGRAIAAAPKGGRRRNRAKPRRGPAGIAPAMAARMLEALHSSMPGAAVASRPAAGAPGTAATAPRPAAPPPRTAEVAPAPPPLWASLGFIASDESDELAGSFPGDAAAAVAAPPEPTPDATALSALIDVDLTGANLAAARVRSAIARSRK
jgi:hypothetical protein